MGIDLATAPPYGYSNWGYYNYGPCGAPHTTVPWWYDLTLGVNIWHRRSLVAEHYGRGRVFLAGDLERDDAATEELRKRLGAELERVVGREFRTAGAQLGYRYDPSPICVADGTPAPPDPMDTYVPTARPGSRAPHGWLSDGRSTLDLFGRGLTLLRFAEGMDTSGLHAAAAKRGVPLCEVAIENSAVASLYERTLVLVRPDGHVAWRGDALPSDAGRIVDQVIGWA